ncbi:MAG: TolC family protein [Chitinophagaceae bacterium]|nr:TolC family protein [Chitinophagaceae bacterium]
MTMKRTKRWSGLILACCFYIVASAQSDSMNFTLQKCIETAIRNNLTIKQTEWQMRTGKVTMDEAKANLLPYVSGNISHGMNRGRNIDPFTNSYVNQQITFANYGLNGSMILWNAGSNRNALTASREAYEAGRMDVQQAKENITINVILAYLQVVNNEEQLLQATRQTDVTRQQLKRLDILNNGGAIAPATYYDMKGQLASDEINELNIRGALESSKLVLAELMNVPYSSSIQLAPVEINSLPEKAEEHLQQVYDAASKQLAVIKAADLRIASAQAGYRSALGQRLPSLYVSTGLGTNYSSAASTAQLVSSTDVPTSDYVTVNGNKLPVFTTQRTYNDSKINYINQFTNNFNSSLSVGIRVPILNGGQARGRIELSKIDIERANFQALTTRNQLQQQIEQAILNKSLAYDKLAKLTQQVNDFTASFKAAEIRFSAGVGSIVEYVIAKNNLDRANSNLIAARYEYLVRNKIMDYYLGRPLF